MAYFPKIATFYYRDQKIDIKIPIRVKLIEIQKYECTKCKTIGTINQIVRFFEETYKDDMLLLKSKYLPKFGRMMIPEKLLYGEDILCPKCFAKTNILKKEIIKFYVCSNPKFIKVEEMLDFFTLLRWYKDFHGNICCYPKTFDVGINGLRYVNGRKEKKAKIRINKKVDMSLLKSELREYIKRKFVDLL